MDHERVVTALLEGLVGYGFFLLTTTPPSDLRRAESRALMSIARVAQRTAAWFGTVAMYTERMAAECLS